VDVAWRGRVRAADRVRDVSKSPARTIDRKDAHSQFGPHWELADGDCFAHLSPRAHCWLCGWWIGAGSGGFGARRPRSSVCPPLWPRAEEIVLDARVVLFRFSRFFAYRDCVGSRTCTQDFAERLSETLKERRPRNEQRKRVRAQGIFVAVRWLLRSLLLIGAG